MNLLHGGDYNPEQWRDYPEILEQDIEYMKKAHINCATVNVFGWSSIEAEEGVYNFAFLTSIINRLYENGIYVILGTPSGAMPQWLMNNYPEVLVVKPNGIRNLPGERHNFCFSSPVMRDRVKKINHLLAENYANHPGVIMWHISNEIGNSLNRGECHCELCQQRFRLFLKEKYQTLDNLNQAWWTTFWSHNFTNWNQIHSPAPHGEMCIHGLNLEWKHFNTVQAMEFVQIEYDAVHHFNPSIPITTNFMNFYNPHNYGPYSKIVDVIAFDSYPQWHLNEDELVEAIDAAFNFNMMRTFKKQPFYLMESTPSLVNWRDKNFHKKPGMHMLSSMQAVAHGSNSVLYFQFRKGRGAFEKYHGAVVDHNGRSDTRVFQDVTAVGERLETISNRVCSTINQPEVAMIFDWTNWWTLQNTSANCKEIHYPKLCCQYYTPFWKSGIDMDVMDAHGNLEDYKVIIAPAMYSYTKEYAEKVRAYVEKGGIYIGTYWTGHVNETDLCYQQDAPAYLQDVFGMIREEVDSCNAYYPIQVNYKGEERTIYGINERLVVSTAEVIASYQGGFYQDIPCVTKNSYGNGTAYYIGIEQTEEFLTEILKEIMELGALSCDIANDLPRGVTINKRVGEETLYFVQNFNPYEVKMQLKKSCEVLESKEMVRELILNAYDCVIVK